MKRTIIYCLILVFLFTSCTKNSHEVKRNESSNLGSTDNNLCIKPVVTFAYPINQGSTNEPQNIVNYPPLEPWIEITTIPVMDYSIKTLMTHTTKDGKNQIWFVSGGGPREDLQLQSVTESIFIYETKSNKWVQIKGIISGSQSQVTGIYILNNGDIWADGFSFPNHIIGKFDEERQEFKIVNTKEEVPYGPIVYDTKRNIFWIFKDNDGIYSLDPVTTHVEFWISLPNLYIKTMNDSLSSTVSLGPDGFLYFLYSNDTVTNGLFQFIPETKELKYIYNPLEELYPPTNLFITNSGDIWINDLGWRDKNDMWYQVVRSQVFINNRQSESGYKFAWSYANLIFESSNGALWFRSANGLTELDTKQEKWCWFTTDDISLLAEDDNKTLWLIAYGKLYKQEIK